LEGRDHVPVLSKYGHFTFTLLILGDFGEFANVWGLTGKTMFISHRKQFIFTIPSPKLAK
jgi:hypothetical protein